LFPKTCHFTDSQHLHSTPKWQADGGPSGAVPITQLKGGGVDKGTSADEHLLDIWEHRGTSRKSGFTWFYMVLHGVTWFYMVLHGFTWFYMVLHGFTWFYMVLHGFTWFYMALHGFTMFKYQHTFKKKKHEKPLLMVDLFIWLLGAQRRKGSGVFETRETQEFPITVR